MNPLAKFQVALDRLPLIAILRGITPQEVLAVGQVLDQNGWGLIEVPLNSPNALDSIARLAHALPQTLVGAGTVLSAQQVREVHAAGAQLIVAPNFNLEVVSEAVRLGLVCLPGVMTPSEAFAALAAGAHGLKLFPSELISPAGVKALRAVLPASTLLFPVGGISLDNLGAYWAATCNGFGIGSAVYRPGSSAEQVKLNALKFSASWHSLGRSHEKLG